jgi:hypothetical protein
MLKGLVTSCPDGAGETVMFTFVVAIWPGGISSVSAVKAKRMTFSGSSPRIVTEDLALHRDCPAPRAHSRAVGSSAVERWD